MKTLNRKTAFVTGSSWGIGRATALAFARGNTNVAVVDRSIDGGKETVQLIKDNGGSAIFIQCDVSNEGDVKGAIRETVKAFGSLDYGFNNAGIEGQENKTADCTLENWDHVINTNLKGTWLCMKYQIQEMLKQQAGVIVNCSSIAGLVGFPGIPAYVASKHGVLGLTKNAALEYAQMNIRINAVCPGVIQTPMITRFVHGDAQLQRTLESREPVGRFGKPEEVAEAVVWLCSEKASFVTGHPMVIDGGWVTQ